MMGEGSKTKQNNHEVMIYVVPMVVGIRNNVL
jgi:hypothetical protein